MKIHQTLQYIICTIYILWIDYLCCWNRFIESDWHEFKCRELGGEGCNGKEMGQGGGVLARGILRYIAPSPPILNPLLEYLCFHDAGTHTHTQTDTCNAATYASKHLYFVWKYVCRPIISTCMIYTYRIPTHLAPWSILDMSAGNLLGSIDGEGWGAERVGRRVGASGWRKEKYAQHPQARKCAACALFLQSHGWPGLFVWKQIMKCVLHKMYE